MMEEAEHHMMIKNSELIGIFQRQTPYAKYSDWWLGADHLDQKCTLLRGLMFTISDHRSS